MRTDLFYIRLKSRADREQPDLQLELDTCNDTTIVVRDYAGRNLVQTQASPELRAVDSEPKGGDPCIVRRRWHSRAPG